MHRIAFVAFLVLVGVLFVLAWGVDIPPGTDIDSCGTIQSPGVYNLSADLGGASEISGPNSFCIRINASNVTLDCKSHFITNDLTPNATGVFMMPTRTNITVKDCTVIGYTRFGIHVLSSNSFAINNSVLANPIGIFIANVQNNTFENNTVAFNQDYGFQLGNGVVNNTFIGNTVNNNQNFINPNSGGFYLTASTSNKLLSNQIHHNLNGVVISFNSNRNLLSGNTIWNNTNRGTSIVQSNFTTIAGDTYYDHATDNAVFIGDFANNNTVENSTAYNNDIGFNLASSLGQTRYNIFRNNTAYNNNRGFKIDGMSLLTGGPRNNLFANNTGYNNVEPAFLLSYANDNTFFGNTAYNNFFGFILEFSNNNTLVNNKAYGNNIAGFISVDGSSANIFDGNIAYWNNPNDLVVDVSSGSNIIPRTNPLNGLPLGGFVFFDGLGNNNLSNNRAYENNQSGMTFFMSNSNSINFNTLENNLMFGIFLDTSNNYLIEKNLIANQSNDNCTNGDREVGIFVSKSDGTVLQKNYYYNNSCVNTLLNISPNSDIDVVTGGSPISYYIIENLFDNPAGNMKNYTVLSLNASLVNNETRIYWNDESLIEQAMGLPPGRSSFMGTAVSIDSGTPINSTIWSWSDGELAGYDENTFELWEYSQFGYQNMNATLNTAANTLNLSNFQPNSVFLIFSSVTAPTATNVSSCENISSSGSYILNANLEGASISATEIVPGDWACIKIATSNVTLDCNGFNITNNGTAGTTFGVLLNGSLTNVNVKNCPGISGYTNGLHSHFSSNGVFSNIHAFNNSQNGFFLNGGNSNSISGSVANNNSNGFFVQSSGGALLTGTTAFGNGNSGIYVQLSNGTTLNSPTFYNNGNDLILSKISLGQMMVSMSGGLFLNPLGTLENYTNLSLTDNLNNAGDEIYSINWTTNSTGMPDTLHGSFAQKFVDISSISFVPANIDSTVWHWTDSESSAYNESTLTLWVLNSTGSWLEVNNTPNTVANTLSLSNFNASSMYAILFKVECSVSADCPVSKPVCSNNICTACTLDNDCSPHPGFPYCSAGGCVECLPGQGETQCGFGNGLICSNNQCAFCTAGTECNADYGVGSICTITEINPLFSNCGNCTQDTSGHGMCAQQYSGLPWCGPSNKCVACLSDSNCPASAPVCSNNVCGPCANNTVCADNHPPATICSVGQCVVPECVTDQECANTQPFEPACEGNVCFKCGLGTSEGAPDFYCANYFFNNETHQGTPVCNATAHNCVQCTSDLSCEQNFYPTPGLPDCKLQTQSCVQCTSNATCAQLFPSVPVCKTSTNTCVKCLTNADCPQDTPFCTTNNVCIKGQPPSSGGGGGGGCFGSITAEFTPGCQKNVVVVKAASQPIVGTTVNVYKDAVYKDAVQIASGSTDSNGTFDFSSTEGDVQIYVSSYNRGGCSYSAPGGFFTKTLKTTSECLPSECTRDSECPTNYVCSNNKCSYVAPPPPPPPTQPPECSSDFECATYQFCSGGSCVPVTGTCGYVENHTWNSYDCCLDSDCAPGNICTDNKCASVQYDLTATGGFVGETGTASASVGGLPFNGQLRVTKPDSTWEIVPVSDGQLSILLDQEGDYSIDLLVNGKLVKSVVIQSLPKPPVPPAEGPSFFDVLAQPGMLLILLIILGAGAFLIYRFYFAAEKPKKK